MGANHFDPAARRREKEPSIASDIVDQIGFEIGTVRLGARKLVARVANLSSAAAELPATITEVTHDLRPKVHDTAHFLAEKLHLVKNAA